MVGFLLCCVVLRFVGPGVTVRELGLRRSGFALFSALRGRCTGVVVAEGIWYLGGSRVWWIDCSWTLGLLIHGVVMIGMVRQGP